MPLRYLKPGLRTSQKWNATSYSAQSLFIAILTLVDDYGRYDARPNLLHGECRILRVQTPALDRTWPQLPGVIASSPPTNVCNCEQTSADLEELNVRKLIQLYSVDGKDYLQITNWQERIRQKHSRYPAPPGETRGQVPADAGQMSGNCAPPTPYALRLTPNANANVRADDSNCQQVDEPVQHAEAQQILREMAIKHFGERINTWGEKKIYDDWLSNALPIPRPQFEALQWLYDLPAQHEIFTNGAHPAHTKRRWSFARLLENLRAEAQKAEGIRRSLQGGEEVELPAWPRGMSDLFREQWPEREIPQSFRELAEGERDLLFDLRRKKNAAA